MLSVTRHVSRESNTARAAAGPIISSSREKLGNEIAGNPIGVAHRGKIDDTPKFLAAIEANVVKPMKA